MQHLSLGGKTNRLGNLKQTYYWLKNFSTKLFCKLCSTKFDICIKMHEGCLFLSSFLPWPKPMFLAFFLVNTHTYTFCMFCSRWSWSFLSHQGLSSTQATVPVSRVKNAVQKPTSWISMNVQLYNQTVRLFCSLIISIFFSVQSFLDSPWYDFMISSLTRLQLIKSRDPISSASLIKLPAQMDYPQNFIKPLEMYWQNL